MLFVRAFYVHESHFSMGSRRISVGPAELQTVFD
eukprot:COSAG01_NODE_61658_length_288_cov_1.095238_1_plen_33_part_01